MTSPAAIVRPAPNSPQPPALIIGVIALIAAGLCANSAPAQFFRGYLVAWLFVFGLAMGSLALVMVHHLTGGVWGVVLRRPLEAQMRTLPLVALLFVPLALGLDDVFPWAGASSSNRTNENRMYEIYFQHAWFFGRWIVYFMLWIALAWLLARWSRKEDETGNVTWARKCQSLSGPGLVVYGITLHFASIDWIMSVQPAFISTIVGPIVATGQLLSAFAFALALFASLTTRAELIAVLSPKLLSDLGGLMFTLVVVWAYLVWFQFMLIWMGDLPRDNVWCLARAHGGWQAVGWVIALLHFVVPFFLLLFRAIKHNVRALALVAALLLVMQLVFVDYQIIPAFPAAGLVQHVLVCVLAVGLSSVWLSAFLWLVGQRPLVPLHDRNLHEAARLRHLDDEDTTCEETIVHA
jgi:hypothetical protein